VGKWRGGGRRGGRRKEKGEVKRVNVVVFYTGGEVVLEN